MTDLAATFRKPFAEQVAAFRLRLANLVPTARYDDISHGQHDQSLMIAGAMKADLLADIGAALDRGIAEGTSLETFRRDFRSIVERHGWHGWTGEGTVKGEAWRTRVIYKTNAATSYAAGRMAQLRAAGFPYFVYFHGGSLEPRLQHLAWNGLVLPSDHPFWDTHAPPNGWGCKCYLSGARSLAMARRLGGDPDMQLPPDWDKIDPRTAAPVGIGKGWDFSPGASVTDTIRTMTQKTVFWPTEIAKAYMAGLPDRVRDDFARGFRALPSLAKDVERYLERVIAPRPTAATVGQAPLQPYRTLGQLTGKQVALIRQAAPDLDVGGFDFVLDASAILHSLKQHGNSASEARRGQVAITVGDFAMLAGLLDGPGRFELAGVSRGSGQPVIRWIRVVGGTEWVVVFELRRGRLMLALETFYIRRLK